jgi:hypothetical protein
VKDKEGWRTRSYQIPLDSVFILEIASVLLGITATIVSIYRAHYAVLLIVIPYTISYFFISLMTFKQSQPGVSA